MNLLLLILSFLLFASPLWGASIYVDSTKGIDTATGGKPDSAVKSMIAVDKLISAAKIGDSLIIVGIPVWGIQTGVDAEKQPIYDIKEGCIQHHLIPGGKMRTVIEIGKTRLIGTSTISEKGEIETVIEKTEPAKITEGKIEEVKP